LRTATPRYTIRDFLSMREGAVVMVTVVMVAIFTSLNSGFFTLGNSKVLADFVVGNVAVAAAQVMLMIVGEIDLSVGQVYALAPYLMYMVYQQSLPEKHGLGFAVAIPVAILAAALVGLINGVVTVRLRVPSLITTLGMEYFLGGFIIYISSGAYQIMPRQEPYTTLFGGGVIDGIVLTYAWTAVALILLAIVLARMRHGIWSIATGSNLFGSREVGVGIHRTKIINFILASVMAGLWGIFIANRAYTFGAQGVADPTLGGDTLTLESVAAAVIGGTSLLGGSGTVIGALAGSLLIAVLQDGLILVGATAYIYQTLLGAAIIFSMALNITARKWARR
jgi:simple sugar transport system permease protein